MSTPLVSAYMQHLQARERLRNGNAALPGELDDLCRRDPHQCLRLIVETLEQPVTPFMIEVVGSELLENLLNENSAALADDVSALLRKNERFRQAFSFGNHASVDIAIVEDWAAVLKGIGTTKAKERKNLRKRPA